MNIQFHDLRLNLQCDNEHTLNHWRALFDGFAQTDVASGQPPDIRFTVQITQTLPPTPTTIPFFLDTGHSQNASKPNLAAYRLTKGQVLLRFLDGAAVTLPLGQPAKTSVSIEAVITPTIFRRGRIEDVTMAALAAVLRPRGYFLLHAFAAARNGQAILLIGQSGSGKTTTGLNLMGHGWRYLANDLTLLQQRPDGIYALRSPGGFSIKPESLRWLPQLGPLAGLLPLNPDDGKYHVPASRLITRRATASRIGALYFPQVSNAATSHLQPITPAIALARLMAESVDSWDEFTLDTHINFLQTLSAQAPGAVLTLGQDISRLPHLLTTVQHAGNCRQSTDYAC